MNRIDATSLVFPLGALALLEILSASGGIDARYVPTPSVVVRGAIQLVESKELWPELLATVLRVTVGFASASALAIGMGLWLGVSRQARPYWLPTVELLRSVPGVALLPLTLLWFGLGSGSLVPVIAFVAFFPTLLTTMRGVEETPAVLVEAARVMELSRTKLFWKVVLPASVPHVFTGLKLSVVYAITSGVGAEYLAGTDGLGFLILDTQRRFDSPKMFAAMVTVALVGFAASTALGAVERRLLAHRT